MIVAWGKVTTLSPPYCILDVTFPRALLEGCGVRGSRVNYLCSLTLKPQSCEIQQHTATYASATTSLLMYMASKLGWHNLDITLASPLAESSLCLTSEEIGVGWQSNEGKFIYATL